MDCAGSLNGKGRNVQAGGLLPVAEYAPKSAILPYWTAWEPQIAVGV